MDMLPDLPGALGGFGALGLLAWWGLRVMSQTASDRKAAAELLAAERNAHAEKIKDKNAEIVACQEEIRSLRQLLENERQARWEAEDAAAKWRRRAEVSE